MTKLKNCNTKELHEFMRDNKYGWHPLNMKFQNLPYHTFEKKVVDAISENKRTLIVKSRQMYMSTLLATYSAWEVINGRRVFLVGPRLDTSKNILKNIREILIQNDIDQFRVDNTTQLTLHNNGCFVKVLSSSPESFRGWDLEDSTVIYDEAAYINHLRDLLRVMEPVTHTTTKIILSSTPNKLNDFYELFHEAASGRNSFKTVRVNYKDNPNHGNGWLKIMKRQLSEEQYRQEVLGEFIMPKYDKKLDSVIQFRVDDELMQKISRQLIKKDVNISTYMRDLILKDVNS